MSEPGKNYPGGRPSELGIIYVAAASVVMIALTFVISNTEMELATKYLILAPAAFVYLVLSIYIFLWQRRSGNAVATSESAFTSEIESKLASLSDANEFFGASLRPDDLFRLLTSRINEIVPFASCVLYVKDPESGLLRVKCAAGENAQHFSATGGALARSVAARAAETGSTVRDENLETESAAHGPEALRGLASAVAAPLAIDGESYGALVLYSHTPADFSAPLVIHFAAATERIAPLIASSFAFEKSIDNALTDPVTALPNERGFFLVLESRIAESHRFREAKALAVLSMDIAGFSDFNQTFGHAAGNRLLAHVAAISKNQLRQMDVITRSAGDEFLAILPTATESVTGEIVNRLKMAVAEKPFEMDHGTSFAINLNFGVSNFGRDGETAHSLLQMARVRKQEAKSREGKVLFFPKDIVN